VGDAEAMAGRLGAIALVIPMKSEEGKIFGSVTSTILAEALAAKGVEVDRRSIAVEPVKTLGEYEAVVKLYKTIVAPVRFTVIAEE
jgi:large subunit ribosomal protein L9